MVRLNLPSIVLLLGLIAGETIVWDRPLFGQGNRTGLSPQDQKKYDDLVASGKHYETMGYLAGGAGILLVVAAIPLSMYFDRRKKSRQKAREEEAKPRDKSSAKSLLKKPKP